MVSLFKKNIILFRGTYCITDESRTLNSIKTYMQNVKTFPLNKGIGILSLIRKNA